MLTKDNLLKFAVVVLTVLAAGAIHAQIPNCASITVNNNGTVSQLTWDYFHSLLMTAVNQEKSGLKNQMWATIVDRDGRVCIVAFSGVNRGAQWPGSRIISAEKANTANAFSLDSSSALGGGAPGQPDGLALSTANLYSAVQPGGSLWGLDASNTLNTAVAYGGVAAEYGQTDDPMIGQKIGGVITFGGGLALYNVNHAIVGGLGVSGDTSCTDHNVAWRLRHLLGLDHLGSSPNADAVPGPASLFANDPSHPDNIIFDISKQGVSDSGFGHPSCLNVNAPSTLPSVAP